MDINKYKCNNVQTLQSQVHDSVENYKLTMSQEKPLYQVLLPLIPPLAQKLIQKKFSPYPYGNPLMTNLLMNALQTSDEKVAASIQPIAKLNLKV